MVNSEWLMVDGCGHWRSLSEGFSLPPRLRVTGLIATESFTMND